MHHSTGRPGGHRYGGLTGLDGHLGTLARILSLGITAEQESGTGTGSEDNPPPPRQRSNGTGNNERRTSRRDDDDDDDDEYHEPVENAAGNRWRKPSAYEIRLRKENEAARKKAQRAKDESEQTIAQLTQKHADDLKAAKIAADKALADATTASDERLKRMHIKAALTGAECQNVEDALKLIDGSGIKISDEGDVEGVQALIEQLKKDKAYLFTAPKASTSSTAQKPDPSEAATKTATDMTPEEYEVARAAYTGSSSRRRRSA